MYKFFAILSTILILGSCGICNHLPQEHIVVRDSVAVSYKDSTIYHHQTVNKDYTGLLDTLRIQGIHSSMKAFADTTHFTIKGELKEEPIKERIREKIVYREHRDTLWREKEIPVEVEKIKEVVPRWAWYLLALFVLEAIYIGIRIYIKLKLDNPSLLKKN